MLNMNDEDIKKIEKELYLMSPMNTSYDDYKKKLVEYIKIIKKGIIK